MLPLLKDQAGIAQLSEMEGEGAVWHAKRFGDGAGRHAPVAGLHQESEQAQTMLLSERGKRLDRGGGLHQRIPAQRISRAQQGDRRGAVSDASHRANL